GSYVNGVWTPVVYTRTYTAPDGVTTATAQPDYLFLVNGVDDNQDGYIDDGFDGIDNDGNGVIDDALEWEAERWTGAAVQNAPYAITRRPAPGNPNQALLLTVPVSLAASTLAVDRLSG